MLMNLPVGQLIRLLVENKADEKALQEEIDKFFNAYSNRQWKNLFLLLKSSEKYSALELERGLNKLDENYFHVRPDWWIDYLPWYEGGPTHVITTEPSNK